MAPVIPIGLGCMRLSTLPERDDDAAIATLHAALDAGATLLDTANVYCHDDGDIGHNERLIATALARWRGDRSAITIATKGGLTRPGGAWVPDGRAKALRSACEASCSALGVEQIDLYQLHAPDPRVPFLTGVRALAKLQQDGLIREIGLCNVGLAQVQAAREVAQIASVQVELSAVADSPLRNGVAEYCREHGIRLIAHSPLGGPRKRARLAKIPALREVAEARGASSEEVALAWLRDLAPATILPIPGATRPESARSAANAPQLSLSAGERERLDDALPAGRRFRAPRAERRPPREAPADVVLIMGYPAAGKSALARGWTEEGYARLNRDERGGRLAGLAEALDAGLAAGQRRFVLDNTYATRESRNAVIETAWEHGLNVRCQWPQTSLEDAQVNAVTRMLERHGQLLDPDALRALSRSDPASFPPRAQFDYRRDFEPPSPNEGFSAIEELPFVRTRDPNAKQRALIVEYDGVLIEGMSGEPGFAAGGDVRLLPARAAVLRHYRDEGWLLLGLSWQPGVEEGTISADAAEAAFAAVNDRLGVDLETRYCPHRAGPPRCWCRKPLPGLGVQHIRDHRLDPSACVFVGRNPTDRLFAERLGFQYQAAEEFFEDA